MALYIKTDFDNKPRTFNTNIVHFLKKNDMIDPKKFVEFNDIENTGIVDIKVHPNTIKMWYDSLPEDARDKGYVIIWENGWISIPGKNIEQLSLEP